MACQHERAKISPKPIGFYLSQGWYHCTTCNPELDVQADGQDHAVTGQPYDTLSVKEVDPKTIAITTKKGGNIDSEQPGPFPPTASSHRQHHLTS